MVIGQIDEKGQAALARTVLERGLCTGCGACIGLCPYFASSKDATVQIDACDRAEGRCYAYCPRTPTDLEAIRQELYAAETITPELGPFRRFAITRAADEEIRARAQHGGTVTALLTLALQAGMIDEAVLAEAVSYTHLTLPTN